jgi:3-deoxy-D-manno-octulosonic acid (KDO) 8-phosphate synthase
VDVVGHDNEGMEFVVLSGPVVLESRDEEFSVGGNLEEAASVVSCGGDEECSGA